MKQLATSLLATLLLSAATAAAQTTFRIGPRGGLNYATTAGEVADNNSFYTVSANNSVLYAWQAGAVFEASFGKISLQPGLQFSQKGTKFYHAIESNDSGFPYFSEQTGTTRSNWLELPLNVVYTLHGDHGLQLFAGPYVALAVGGRQRGSTQNYFNGIVGYSQQEFDDPLNYGSGTTNRRLDAGFNFGIGYRQGPVQMQLGYGLGLRNLHQNTGGSLVYDYGHNFTADAAHNRTAQLTGTYFFAL